MSGRKGAPELGGERPRYQPFYCEENVYHLAASRAPEHSARAVVFVSNVHGSVAMWEQRAGRPPDGLVVWDYHVVLAGHREGEWEVFDLDSILDFPVPLRTWLERTFQPLPPAYRRFGPRFRIVDADEYASEFSSDRTHMLHDEGGFIEPPPDWPAIVRPGAPGFLRWTLMEPGDDAVGLSQLAGALSSQLAPLH